MLENFSHGIIRETTTKQGHVLEGCPRHGASGNNNTIRKGELLERGIDVEEIRIRIVVVKIESEGQILHVSGHDELDGGRFW